MSQTEELRAGVNEYERVRDCGIAVPCMSNPWAIHVYHLDDPHHIDDSQPCWCDPTTEIHDGITVFIHNRKQ